MTDKVRDILNEKAKDYDTPAGQAWEIVGQLLTWFQVHGLLDKILPSGWGFVWIIILVKLVRLSQSPNHADSWLDIAGYATLVSDRLTKEQVSQCNTM
jgi:hypothetical protein